MCNEVRGIKILGKLNLAYTKETNFDSSGFYDPTTNNVVCYVKFKYWEDLIDKRGSLSKFNTVYDDGLPEIVIENFSVNND